MGRGQVLPALSRTLDVDQDAEMFLLVLMGTIIGCSWLVTNKPEYTWDWPNRKNRSGLGSNPIESWDCANSALLCEFMVSKRRCIGILFSLC